MVFIVTFFPPGLTFELWGREVEVFVHLVGVSGGQVVQSPCLRYSNTWVLWFRWRASLVFSSCHISMFQLPYLLRFGNKSLNVQYIYTLGLLKKLVECEKDWTGETDLTFKSRLIMRKVSGMMEMYILRGFGYWGECVCQNLDLSLYLYILLYNFKNREHKY